MNHPKTIKIYLVNGEPDGIKTAELSNWVGKAISIPRNQLKDVKDNQFCNQPAVYFLIGKDDDETNLANVYVGEAEILWKRLASHESTKDFWQLAIGFISKDNNLTKAHIKYLESRCLTMAKLLARCNLVNSVESAIPNLSESDISEMEEYLDNLKVLLASLGFPFLHEVVSKENKKDGLFFCKGKGASGEGKLTSEGFIVYKGSTASTQISDAVKKRNEALINALIQSGHLVKKSDDLYFFEKDYLFNSPSAASDLITGNSTSGWAMWKTKSGKSLKDIEQQKLID